jgi:hypothetical protein
MSSHLIKKAIDLDCLRKPSLHIYAGCNSKLWTNSVNKFFMPNKQKLSVLIFVRKHLILELSLKHYFQFRALISNVAVSYSSENECSLTHIEIDSSYFSMLRLVCIQTVKLSLSNLGKCQSGFAYS